MSSLRKAEKSSKTTLKPPPQNAGFWQVFWYRLSYWSVHHKFWQRFGLVFLVLLLLSLSGTFAIGTWYENKLKKQPMIIGATFIPNYARYFELDPRQTFAAMIDELGIKHFRLVSYWSNIERDRGVYNFDDLDWQFAMAEEKGAKISLAIGLRQPRWPECHMPTWAEEIRGDSWHQPLYDFMAAVVNRYKHSPALESYQLENEFFLSVFTKCADNSKDRLIKEFNLVKQLDSVHPVIMSVSGDFGVAVGDEPAPDIYAMALYKRVYDPRFVGRYIEYPFPEWLYSGRAGLMHLLHGKPVFFHEVQAEPWTPIGDIVNTPLQEQDKSMNPVILADRFDYLEKTGLKRGDMWGVEWWYWRKVKHGDSRVWDTGKTELRRIEQQNQALVERR